MVTVYLSGWNPGFNKVRLNMVLREEGGLALAEAKQLVDAILENRPVELTLDAPAARRLAARAIECGVNATLDER
jgi:hypothetical protein